MSNSIKLIINANNPEQREELIAQLSLFEIDGFEETETELVCYYKEQNKDEDDLIEKLNYIEASYYKSIVYEQNWNREWESSFDPVVVDNFCMIRACFHQPNPAIRHEIIITPKMSFGTGHHATTFLMVQQMSKIDFKNKTVADFGTGTGVLSILAEKLGGTNIWAIDNDDWSIKNAKENIETNHCQKIKVEKFNSFRPAQQFDVILANINKNTILNNLNGLIFGLQSGGKLLVSGLLKTDEQEVRISFEKNNFIHTTTVEKDNWISMTLILNT